jgi:Listeria/Bacterioides repeat
MREKDKIFHFIFTIHTNRNKNCHNKKKVVVQMKKILTMLLVTLAFILVIGNSSEALAATKFQTVKFNSGGGTAVAAKKVVFQALLSTPRTPKRTGYTFGGWYQDKTLTKLWNFKTSRVKKNVTLYAKWKPITYKVTFNSKGGSSVSKQTVTNKGLVKKPKNPIRLGYSFVSWYKDTKYKKSWNFSKDRITKNVTVYAKWKVQSARSVTFDSTGGSPVAPVAVAHNSLLNPPASQRNGFTFAGWFRDPNLQTPWNAASNRVSSNIVLYAKWVQNIYTVSFDSKGGTPIAAQQIAFGCAFPQPVPPTKIGNTFAGWYTGPDLVTPYDFTLGIGGNITLYAKWNVVAATSYRAIVTAAAVNLRTSPDSSGITNLLNPPVALSKNAIIDVSPSGTPGWFLTNYNGQTVYVASSVTDATGKVTVQVQLTAYACKVLAAAGTNIFTGPDPASPVVGTLTSGSYVSVVPYMDNPNFVQVCPSAGKFGYVQVSDLQQLYYDTLNIHTPSPVTADQINNFIINYENNNKKVSVFHGAGQTFIDVGNAAGINPLILTAIAIHESGYGTSALAQHKFNIFSIAAYDDSPYDSAYTFRSVDEAIRYQADFLNKGYLNSPYSTGRYTMMGDFLGTNGLPGLNSVGEAGVNAYYATGNTWGPGIASLCEQIVPYDPNYYATAAPMVAKGLNYPDLSFLQIVDNDFYKGGAGFAIIGRNKGPALNIYTTLGGTATVNDANGVSVSLLTFSPGNTVNDGAFQVLNFYGNAYNGWMHIATSINGVWTTGFINFGGLSGYASRFTFDNLIRNTTDWTYAAQALPYEVDAPVGYVKCYR